ncbi:glycosyltransferase family 87 protein [Parvibaculum sp.]|uniref:glycosyltransferase family 87 protein n=1 Tax=Parvibaculum sp. TaxID=2024848 RepID=UPI002B70428A|nr:glycosyltransferase family 87 protein [Parvibaculum sp.]HUD50569.1 glycosyltransferase family 87 protein [Parvibaculum sp.]
MSQEPDSMRGGAGFQPDRWTLFVVLSFGLIACDAWLLLQAARQGLWLVDLNGAPAPLDFSAFWAAGRLAVEGKAALAYDWGALRAIVEAASGRSFAAAHYPIFYPPVFFFFVAPLGWFSYFDAAVIWVGTTLAAYLLAACAILPKRVVLPIALAAPAVLWCVCVGQNGLLSAALIGGGLALLERRPLLAGVLFGALVFKPQFGVLIPFVLIVSGNWRAFASAAATVVLLFLAAGLCFGVDVYAAFIAAVTTANDKLLNVGALPWFKVQSFYGLGRSLGFGAPVAWMLHGIVGVVAALATLAIWRGRTPYELKAAALATATLVLSPYSCVYDLPIAVMAILFLLKDDGRLALTKMELAALGFAFLLPLFFPSLRFPVGPFTYAALAGVIGWRAQRIGKW